MSTLKNAITAKCNIPVDQQVLLISGGDYLEDSYLVQQYNSAGTVSNPIFLFDKSVLLSPEQFPLAQLGNQTDNYVEGTLKKMQLELDQTLEMDASLKTVMVRTEIAKRLNQLTTELMSNCEQLIKDQHLQYQGEWKFEAFKDANGFYIWNLKLFLTLTSPALQKGWMACIANLEDVSNSFVEHVRSFEEQVKLFLTKRDYYQKKMKTFKQDLEMLDRIKIMRCLHEDVAEKSAPKEDQTVSGEDQIEGQQAGQKKNAQGEDKADESRPERAEADEEGTLMSLINKKDDKHCLEKVTVYCNKMLEEFTEQLLDRVKAEMAAIIKTIEDNKKIKKIENRLYNLDMLLIDVKQHVKDQNLLTYGFVQNQNSANACNDPTIFADLCMSHKNQLDLMFKSYQKVISIRKKFQNSKRELTYSLLARLKTIMISETELNSLNWHVMLYSESLKKLKRSLEVVDQINLAPKVYFRVFEEISRRNKFNYFFNLWTDFIVQINRSLINAENAQRDEFRQTISSHFLKSFFPRFDDRVPEFGMQSPEPFDRDLPQIDEREFVQFIEANRQFDGRLAEQDSLLNGLVHRMHRLNVSKHVSMKVDDRSDNQSVDRSNNKTDDKMTESLYEKSEQITEQERESLASFVSSLFPIQSKCEDRRVEQIKDRLNDEYERKLAALKLEYSQKLEAELKSIEDNPDDLPYLNCRSDCNGQAGGLADGANLANDLTSSNISNNIAATIECPTEPTNAPSNVQRPAIFLNTKNLIQELLSMKYSEFLENDQPNLFISFVSTILHISLPKSYFL